MFSSFFLFYSITRTLKYKKFRFIKNLLIFVKNFDMECKKCEQEKHIVNKHFGLCNGCNNERLHGNKYGKQYDNIKTKQKPFKTNKTKKKKAKKSLFFQSVENKALSNFEKDEILYEKCFNLSSHRCEECGTQLPDQFRDDNGKIIARWRYSHIIPKSIAPELRHKVENINHLCIKDHGRWEGGDKENMNIFNENSKKFPKYFK